MALLLTVPLVASATAASGMKAQEPVPRSPAPHANATDDPRPENVSLTDLSPVVQSGDLSTASAALGGLVLPNSLVFTCASYCNESASVARVAYDLQRDYSTLSVTAGVTDDAPAAADEATFSVLVDGTTVFERSIARGSPVPFEIDLKDALRLELVITTNLTTVSPLEAGVDAATGKRHDFAHAAWGGGTLKRSTPPVVTIFNKVTNGDALVEDRNPAMLTSEPRPNCRLYGCNFAETEMWTGHQLAVYCTGFGQRVTNGNDHDAADDGNPERYESTRYYRGRWADGRTGWISEVWIEARHRGGLGLRPC